MDFESTMKAIVLCAGYGTRLGELTQEIPKPMLPLNGQPMLAYILGNLKRHGFDEIAINLHFKPEMIRAHFGDGAAGGIKITYSHEPHLLGTAGGVKNVETYFRGAREFLVHYGDVVTDQNFKGMIEFHREHQALATLLVHQRVNSNSVVSLAPDGRVIGFLERPTEVVRQTVKSPWVNSGICICSPEILSFIPANEPCDLPRDVFTPLVATGRLYGFPLSGYRCAIDSPARLAEARAALAESRCCIRPLTTTHSVGQRTLN
jgi:NDP-sugar pyrophosphorylase family protein